MRSGAHTQRLFEAVGRSFLVALAVLLPPLAEEQSLLVQEEVSLHGLETSQVLHFGVTFLVLCPNAERPLHEQLTQFTQIALRMEKRKPSNYVLKLWMKIFF